jgi:hypothetical protein
LFTGPSGIGKTSAVNYALSYLMHETSFLQGTPDAVVETLRGRVMFLEEDMINLALARNGARKAGMKPDVMEQESLALLQTTLADVPHIIFLDDADEDGLRLVRHSLPPPRIFLQQFASACIASRQRRRTLSRVLQALELLPISRKGSSIIITSQTLDSATVMKELVAAGDNDGKPCFFAHEVKPLLPKESMLLMTRCCSPETHGGLYVHLEDIKRILGDGPDPKQHLGHLPLAVRTFAEWASEQYMRFMRSQTPERVQQMVERWLLVRIESF